MDLQHPESLAARGMQAAETLDCACYIQLCLHLEPCHLLGKAFQDCATHLDSVCCSSFAVPEFAAVEGALLLEQEQNAVLHPAAGVHL